MISDRRETQDALNSQIEGNGKSFMAFEIIFDKGAEYWQGGDVGEEDPGSGKEGGSVSWGEIEKALEGKFMSPYRVLNVRRNNVFNFAGDESCGRLSTGEQHGYS